VRGSLIPHVGFLGLEIIGILLKLSQLLGLVEAKLGNDWDIQVGEWGSANMKADVLLIDGVANYTMLEVASKRSKSGGTCSRNAW
jgi:hypothetical protein